MADLTVSVSPAAVSPAAVAEAGPPRTGRRPPAGPPPRRHPAWRAVWTSCVLVPLVVLSPLATQPPWSDERLNVYWHGGDYLNRPWLVPADVLHTVPYFLSVGNFRPLGRTFEWSLDVAVFALSDLFGVPVNIGLRLVALAGAILLTMAAVLLAAAVTARERTFAAAPPVPVVLLPFTVGAGFVAAGRTSTTVLFSGLYLFSGALVLATAAWACRAVRADRPRVRWGVLAVLAGAAIAGFNEMACLAMPLATAAVAVRSRTVFAMPWRAVARDPGVRFMALLWAGFLPVFLPVRAVIAATCAKGGCYDGSAVALPGAAAALPNRLVSWLPPLMWPWAAGGREHWLAGATPLLAAAVLLGPAWQVLRALPRLPVLDRRQTLGLALVAATGLGSAAATGALNVWVQQFAVLGHYGVGWRDSALSTAAGSTLVLTLLAGRHRAAGALLVPVLVVLAATSTAANAAYHERGSTGPAPYVDNRIAQEIADFDRTAAGDTRRCALRAQFLAGTATANEPRVDQILDGAARQVAGRRFCSRAPVRAAIPLYRPVPG